MQSDSINTAQVAEIARHIKHMRGSSATRFPVTFLVGAGFSRSAGIPTATEVVKNDLRTHPLLRSVGPAPPDTSEYAYLMGKLSSRERALVLKNCISRAERGTPPRTQINWAHLLLASLVAEGYVKRILTTNFDPLIVDALALTGQPVRAFDLSASEFFQMGVLDPGAVVYLHGQAHATLLRNTQGEMEQVRPHILTVLQEAISDTTVLIVGYSGDCDPVFAELRDRFRQFPDRLYWVHYSHSGLPPSEPVRRFLCEPRRETFLVSGLDADTFMRELVLESLQLDLPTLVRDPARNALLGLERVLPLPTRNEQPTGSDPVEAARQIVRELQATRRDREHSAPKAPVESTDGSQLDTGVGSNPDTHIPAVSAPPLEVEIALAGAQGNVERLESLRKVVERSGLPRARAKLSAAFRSAGWLALQRGDPAEALRLADTAVSLDGKPRSEVNTLKGTALSRLALRSEACVVRPRVQ
jgi:hypothetical protein